MRERLVSEQAGDRAVSARAGYDGIAAYFDRFAAEEDAWLERTGGYHELLRSITQAMVPRGERVLEIGCGRGDLLASLEPSHGVGVDVSPGMVATARERHPGLHFICAAGEDLQLEERFDYVVLSDLVPYVEDLQALFAAVARHSHPRTRLIVSTYSNAWRPLLAIASVLGLRPNRPVRNWVAPRDLVGLAELAGLEPVVERKEILVPVRSRLLSWIVNGLLGRVPPLPALTLTYWMVARPAAAAGEQWGVSVIVPCRNEAGNIRGIVERVPKMGRETEIVFVENGSTDDTRERIEAELARDGRLDMQLLVSEPGKWKAVQTGFNAARHEVLMILDGDLSVAPEDLPKFYEALVEGRGELINGSRLVYGMEHGAMRFLNLLGNKLYAGVMSRVLGQYVKDTLCGTKALHRDDWKRVDRARAKIGPEDPFGDYHLLLGASLIGLKMLDVPIRYHSRSYGDTKMPRFSYGGTLARLVVAGLRQIWIQPAAGGRRHESTGDRGRV